MQGWASCLPGVASPRQTSVPRGLDAYPDHQPLDSLLIQSLSPLPMIQNHLTVGTTIPLEEMPGDISYLVRYSIHVLRSLFT